MAITPVVRQRERISRSGDRRTGHKLQCADGEVYRPVLPVKQLPPRCPTLEEIAGEVYACVHGVPAREERAHYDRNASNGIFEAGTVVDGLGMLVDHEQAFVTMSVRTQLEGQACAAHKWE